MAAVWYAAEKAALDTSYPDGYPPDWFWMGSEEALVEHLVRHLDPLPTSVSVVAETDGAVVGLGLAGAAEADPAIGVLQSLYVHPGGWGSGAAQAIHSRLLAHLAEGFARADLWVVEGNARARRFYERLGWRDALELNRQPNGLPLVRYTHDLA